MCEPVQQDRNVRDFRKDGLTRFTVCDRLLKLIKFSLRPLQEREGFGWTECIFGPNCNGLACF